MVRPITRMNSEMTGQPQEIAIGPPLFQACPNVVKQPARMEMIENEMAKFEKPDHERSSSWEYPSLASCCSSGDSCFSVMCAPMPGRTGAARGRLKVASGRVERPESRVKKV